MNLTTKRILSGLILGLFIIGSPVKAAEEMTLEAAIKWGWENNPEIIEAREEIESIERDFAAIEADLGWEWEISAEGRKVSENTWKSPRKELAALEGERGFSFGLTFEPKVYLKEQEIEETGLNRDNIHYGLAVEQPLYPWTPTAAQRDYIETDLEMKEAQADLEQEKRGLALDWLEEYLELIELKLELEIEQGYLKLVKKQLAEVEKYYEAGEVGEMELIAAQLDLNDVQQDIEGIKNDYRETKRDLIWELGLKEDQQLKVTTETDFALELLTKVETKLPDLENKELLMSLAKENSNQLFINELEKSELESEMQWEDDDNKPELTFEGDYELEGEEDEWELAIGVEYVLFDSGASDLERIELEQELKELNRERDNLLWELEAELDDLLGEVREERWEVKEENLELKEETLEYEVAQADYQTGDVSNSEYKEIELEYKEQQLDLLAERHELLLIKYELLKFLGGEMDW